jgi:hypothetical protein
LIAFRTTRRRDLVKEGAESNIVCTYCSGGLGCVSHEPRSEKGAKAKTERSKKWRNSGFMTRWGTCKYPSTRCELALHGSTNQWQSPIQVSTAWKTGTNRPLTYM